MKNYNDRNQKKNRKKAVRTTGTGREREEDILRQRMTSQRRIQEQTEKSLNW